MTVTTIAARARPLGNYPHLKAAGDFLFLSGTTARLSDGTPGGMVTGPDGSQRPDAAAQTRIVIEQLRATLDAAGASLRDCVEITVFLKTMRDFAAFNRVYAEYFDADGPARTTVGIVELPHPELVVELRVVAYRPRAAQQS